MTEDLAWLMGLILAEGMVKARSIAISNSELALLNKARSIFEGFGLHCTLTHQAATGEDSISIQGVKCNSNYDTYSLGVSSVVLCDAMRQLGFVENKKLRGKDDKSPSYRKEVPQAILKSSVACRLAFLAGFVEGGGLVRVFQNELRDLPLGAAEGGLHLPQA
jgi:hypothetical protein